MDVFVGKTVKRTKLFRYDNEISLLEVATSIINTTHRK